ncbi:ribokinase [Ahniella affigens]|uniref:Ribokinase n=1 Tax=Ahniella affigens TaxID=2021234 RepID=A0A2P1PNN0_9GAMM|nr:ribokinase [Ahniella affigens]AVP96437.1 ribokinase [Ahniella affigens]
MFPIEVVVVGSYVLDHCWNTQTFPKVGETRIGTFSAGPGGKGFNQAVASQRQGARTAFLGAIGKDLLGDTARQFAESEGLHAVFDVRPDVPTAAASIVVDAKGQNLICVALGANETLSPEFVRSQEKLISQAKVLICQLENNLEATRTALQLARQHKVLSILNPAPINEKLDLELLRLADVITPNESEFAFLVKHLLNRDLHQHFFNLADGLVHLMCRELGVPTVIITLGEAGCFISHDTVQRRGDGDLCYRIPAESVRVRDTTGAGDAFNGGLAAGLVQNAFAKPFREALRYANQVAGLSTEAAGAAPAMPTHDQVRARFPS